jgi:hypothetical protein
MMQHDDSNLETDEKAIIPANTARLNTITTARPYSDLRMWSASHRLH